MKTNPMSIAGKTALAGNSVDVVHPATGGVIGQVSEADDAAIKGGFNFSTRAEVEALMGGSASGRVVR